MATFTRAAALISYQLFHATDNMDSLSIRILRNRKITFSKTIPSLQGNYIFGRDSVRCQKLAMRLSIPTTVIEFPSPPTYLSSVHAVICQIEKEFHLIDGWGKKYSRNGVYVNKQRMYFRILQSSDLIHLGSSQVEIMFHQSFQQDHEKDTIESEFF
ncbi:MAG: FHA domain-containing protein [Richelia sp. RM2_1_2]|nr:FHA domain-containing protein [Richelia sp. RM1_1_1]NJO63923.1 FHA domain-containing protein [Richelia sp. RM2_1_2]